MKKCAHYKFYKKIRSSVSVILCLVLMVLSVVPSYAEKSSAQIEKERKEAQKQAELLNAEIKGIKSEISELDADIVAAVEEIEILNLEIEMTQEEIEENSIAYEEAKAATAAQYEAMKIRIKYMYEAKDEGLIAILMGSSNFTEFLNRVEYVTKVHDYDRQKMDEFEALEAEMQSIGEDLYVQMMSLEEAMAELDEAEAELEELMIQKQSELSDAQSDYTQAKQLVTKLTKEKAQAEAREKAAREAAAREAAAKNAKFDVYGTKNPSFSTSVSGSAVVAYANQFVGGKYKWGGTSLTDGCDCSGFVWKVFQNCGVNISSQRPTSSSLRTVGKEVSYNYIQPGDIVCYSGHVAIYAGGGKVVEAQSTKAGITNNRDVGCKNIITIRRVL